MDQEMMIEMKSKTMLELSAVNMAKQSAIDSLMTEMQFKDVLGGLGATIAILAVAIVFLIFLACDVLKLLAHFNIIRPIKELEAIQEWKRIRRRNRIKLPSTKRVHKASRSQIHNQMIKKHIDLNPQTKQEKKPPSLFERIIEKRSKLTAMRPVSQSNQALTTRRLMKNSNNLLTRID